MSKTITESSSQTHLLTSILFMALYVCCPAATDCNGPMSCFCCFHQASKESIESKAISNMESYIMYLWNVYNPRRESHSLYDSNSQMISILRERGNLPICIPRDRGIGTALECVNQQGSSVSLSLLTEWKVSSKLKISCLCRSTYNGRVLPNESPATWWRYSVTLHTRHPMQHQMVRAEYCL